MFSRTFLLSAFVGHCRPGYAAPMAHVGRVSAGHTKPYVFAQFGLSACRPARQGGDLVSEACRPRVGPVFASKREKSRFFPFCFSCLLASSPAFLARFPAAAAAARVPSKLLLPLLSSCSSHGQHRRCPVYFAGKPRNAASVVSLESWGQPVAKHGRNCSGQALPAGPLDVAVLVALRWRLPHVPALRKSWHFLKHAKRSCALLLRENHHFFSHTRLDNFGNCAKTKKQNYLGST